MQTPSRIPSGRPLAGEYASYAAEDLRHVAGEDAIDALAAQEREVVALLAAINETDAAGLMYAPGKWTLKEVIGHLIDDERIFAYRLLCVARRDRRPLPGFDENEYVAAEYSIVRKGTIVLLESLTPEEWLRSGEVNGYQASVRGLAFHIAGHELHHLRVLRERYLQQAER
jgi:hypothetical protein